MKRLIVIAMAVLFCSCADDSGPPELIYKFAGEPYLGTVSVNIVPPGEISTYHWGKASLHFLDSTDRVARLVLFGAIQEGEGDAGDAGLVLDGTYDETGWKFQKHGMRLEINQNGIISGEYNTPAEQYIYTGSISTKEFSLKTVVEMLEETSGGYPAGTKFNFEHTGYRQDPNSQGTAGGSGNCRNIRWEFRNIWNPGGGAMSLIRVPVCHD